MLTIAVVLTIGIVLAFMLLIMGGTLVRIKTLENDVNILKSEYKKVIQEVTEICSTHISEAMVSARADARRTIINSTGEVN